MACGRAHVATDEQDRDGATISHSAELAKGERSGLA